MYRQEYGYPYNNNNENPYYQNNAYNLNGGNVPNIQPPNVTINTIPNVIPNANVIPNINVEEKKEDFFNFYGIIDPGKVPTISEDNMEGFKLLDETVLCMCVADGLGSVVGSQIPSVVVIKEMQKFLNKFLINDTTEHMKYILNLGFYTVNRIIENFQRINPEMFGSFTSTLTIVLINRRKEMVVGHVGNSRLYLLRDNNIIQLTTDDTVANELLVNKEIKEHEYSTHPDRGILTKYMGKYDLEPFIDNGTVQKEDLVLLCTNGLFEMLNDNQIKEIIYETGNSKDACESFVGNANALGGVDNIAAIISYIDF